LLPRVAARVVAAKVAATTVGVTVVVMAEIVAVIGVVDVALRAVADVVDVALRAVVDVARQAGVRGGIVVIAEGAGGHPLGEEAVLEAEEIETEVETEIVIEIGVEIVIVTEGEMVAGRGAAADGETGIWKLLIQVQ